MEKGRECGEKGQRGKRARGKESKRVRRGQESPFIVSQANLAISR